MLKKVALGCFGLIVLLFLVVMAAALFLDRSYAVQREVLIDGTPAAIHAYTGDLVQWAEWSPWIDADPTIVVTLGDQTTGVGASQSWTSAQGPGELTFTKSTPESTTYDMTINFGGNELHSQAWLDAAAEGASTRLTWRIEGTFDFFAGGFLAAAADPMIGPLYDHGLQKLKAKVEGKPMPDNPFPQPGG